MGLRIRKRKTKKSVLESTKRHDLLQKVCMITGAVLTILIVIISSVNIYAYASDYKNRTSEIDYETLNYNQSLYDNQKELFDNAYASFNEQYDKFLYSIYIVETSQTIYYNDNAVQEMYKNLNVLREDAKKLKESADLLNASFVVIEGEENKEYPHLTNTLRTENTKELESLTVALKDLTQTVNNSIVNVDFFNGYIALEEERKNIVLVAESMIGNITYEWGGKPTNQGWNERWNASGKGLDCSGFVQWVYWTALGIYNEDIISTRAISDTQEMISFESLQPGDIGLMFAGGSCYLDAEGNMHDEKEDAIKANKEMGYKPTQIKQLTNHAGIYAGKDMYGQAIWIHCSGESDTVVKDRFNEFECFYRIRN